MSPHSPFDPPTGPRPDWPAADARPRERDGRSPLERHALTRLRQDVASMPASEVVRLALWPESVAHWARDAGVATAVAYNMLGRFKPYRRVRELLALRLGVPGFVLDHLVDAARPLPAAARPVATVDADPAPPPMPPVHVEPTIRLPAVRDGSNPVERRAVWQAWHQIAALPASLVVQLALYPETLADWARRTTMPASMLYATLSGSQPHPSVRESLARRLGVARHALDALIDAPRREPLTPHPPLADLPAPPEPPASEPAPEAPPPPPRDQLALEL